MMAGTPDNAECSRLSILLRRARYNLENLGLVAMSPRTLDPLESAMPNALTHVPPPETFRQALAENLSLAAHGQNTKLEVSRQRHLREGIILGVTAALVAAAVTGLILLLHPRPSTVEQASN